MKQIEDTSRPDAAAETDGGARPRRAFLVLVIVAVVAMLVGVVLGGLVKSPAQQLADAAPPELSVITATVAKRELEAEAVTRGIVELGRSVAVGPLTSSEARSVVTGVHVKAGDQVDAGAVLLEVSGRPIILLQGEFPAYRNLVVGDRGPDAAAVNTALTALQLEAGEADEFTSASSQGLAALYARHGYHPPAGGGVDLRELVFVPGTSATVLSVGAQTGQTSEAESLVVVASGESVIRAKLPPQQAASVTEGNPAKVHLDDGTLIDATVTSVVAGETVDDSEVVLKATQPMDASWNAKDVRVVITQTSSEESVLTVPVPAVFARADGQNVVVRVDGEGKREVVPVEVGELVGGFASVKAVAGTSSIKEGDEVIVSGPGLGE